MSLYELTVCIAAGLGAGLGTGFAGMSAAAVIGPMLIAFLGVDAYAAIGIALASDVLASAVSAITYGKHKNLDIRHGSIMMAAVLLFTAAFSNVFDSLRFTFMGGLRGAGDTKAILFIIGGCSLFVMIPGTWLMTMKFHCNLIQVWFFMVGYCLLLTTLMFFRFRSGAWKKINMIKH